MKLFKMKRKKGQAAMEFLMTYGWAILVVLAAIGALAYFGVLSPAKFFPDTCTIASTSGLACLDFKMTSDTTTLLLANGGGRDIHLGVIDVGGCSLAVDSPLVDGEHRAFNVTGCSFGSSGEKVKKDILIAYNLPGSTLNKTVEGRITTLID